VRCPVLQLHEDCLDATSYGVLQCDALYIYIHIYYYVYIYIYIYTYRGRDLVAALQIVTVTR